MCEIANRPHSPPASLGCKFICATSRFAQKKDANPVGGRGISAFFAKLSLRHRSFAINEQTEEQIGIYRCAQGNLGDAPSERGKNLKI